MLDITVTGAFQVLRYIIRLPSPAASLQGIQRALQTSINLMLTTPKTEMLRCWGKEGLK